MSWLQVTWTSSVHCGCFSSSGPVGSLRVNDAGLAGALLDDEEPAGVVVRPRARTATGLRRGEREAEQVDVGVDLRLVARGQHDGARRVGLLVGRQLDEAPL